MASKAPSLSQDYVHAIHVMNGAPKAAAMFILTGEKKLTGSEMHAGIVDILGSKKGVPHKAAFRSYGLETLVPQGFAQSQTAPYNRRTNITCFAPTEKGNQLGFGAATCALEWSAHTGLSLSEILGESASREKKRGPETRSQILMYLDQVGETYLKDIARAVDTDPAILNKHKKALLKVGMIECIEDGAYVQVHLTGRGRNVLDTCLYPLRAATQSPADLQALIEVGHLLYDAELRKEIFSKAFASHTLKHHHLPRSQR